MLVAVCAGLAQSAGHLKLESGVTEHKGLDAVYSRFAEGYRKLDADLVASLYTRDASYLTPGRNITTGRKSIKKSFSSFFSNVRQRGERVSIAFRIVQRDVDARLAFDVGIYTVSYTAGDRVIRRSRGKFVVVAVKGADGLWRFRVDGYSDVPETTVKDKNPASR